MPVMLVLKNNDEAALSLYSSKHEFELNKRYVVSILPSTGQENNIAQPDTDKWFSFSLHFSSFLTV